MRWIKRNGLERRIERSLGRYPVTRLTGPRQCGKTALARRLSRRLGGAYFDLEDPETPLQPETARTVLVDLRGLVVVDEAQRQPGLLPLLRVLADRRPLPARFLILGSASPDLVRGASESLAGRVSYVDMGGFLGAETGVDNWKRLWLRGGFPLAYLAGANERSHDWRMNFIQSLLEHDLPQLGIRVPAAALRRFWMMLAHYHGQVWNSADLARSMGVK
ncbi:MAG: AAA family ATPase, partial [Candidatus Edwardsbacteria bacterium]|nr:AAA family ATPase [Candidatus Edwardsbacteria bacterium]